MYKVVILIKRRKGMSMDEFIEYYENRHAPLATPMLLNIRRYVRHFIRPFADPTYPAGAEGPADVVTEFWYDSEADFKRAMENVSKPENARVLQADEDKVFDRSSIQIYASEERETQLA